MDTTTRTELLGKLISDKDILTELQLRKSEYIHQSLNNKHKELIDDAIENGWELDREFKTVSRLKKRKNHDIHFEDKVWVLFASLGFTTLNKDRNFRIPYDKNNPSLTQQIDVLAKDDESILIIECKSARKNKKGDFKKELDAIKGNIDGIVKSLRHLYPNDKFKYKYIFATENYALSDPDIDRLSALNAVHFDSDAIEYYSKMFDQIGLAARYQLLGSLFAGQEIPEMDNKIPAIRGKMGGHTYYAFSIEPEKLLKISFVLHRSKANTNMMPTYQRIIRKNRLQSIHKFIEEEKGYFPNSIVISIDCGKKADLGFDPANTQVPSSVATAGILHLPKKYRSAFIIDGQHRLYGYANSSYKESNSIPVVAFLNLDRSEQVKLFMQINENQKPVQKNLRVTLSADLLWTSSDYTEQMTALRSRVALFLGEDRKSPLFDKISIGEDKKIITSAQIDIALKRSHFLGNVTKNKIEKLGIFYKGNIDETYEKLTLYLTLCFDYIKDNVEEIWEGRENIILINKGIYALILIFSDLAQFVLGSEEITDASNPRQIFKEVQTYLDSVIHFYKELDEETAMDLKSTYGTNGDRKYWRTVQKYVRDQHPAFDPDGLEDYLKKEEKEFNTKAFEHIREIETFFKKDFKDRLIAEYGDSLWFKRGVPPKIGEEATKLMYQKNREIENESEEVTAWDCINIIAYREIALKNWKVFEKHYTRPNETKISGGKEAKTEWMMKVERLRNQNVHSYYVTENEYSFIEEIHDWLIGNTEN
ncbi:MAG: DGQHR domain-containing protein [Rikenellaceae bacterium]|nr:DGQHR domain-containing protein [Rikenellaceae bacterium]MCL2692062.1 DGQHR domain-containing protein [Rikenellaceae bacterium]